MAPLSARARGALRAAPPLALLVATLLAAPAGAQPAGDGAVRTDDESGQRGTIRTEGAAAFRTLVGIGYAVDSGLPCDRGLLEPYAEAVYRDLSLSGILLPVDPGTLFFDPLRTGTSAAGINYGNWQSAGADQLVEVQCRRGAGGSEIALVLFDVVGQTEVSLDVGAASSAERSAHAFVNALIEHVSGRLGPFGSRVAFERRGGDGNAEVYELVVGSNGPRAITAHRSISTLPDWREDEVLYMTYANGPQQLVYGPEARVLSTYPGMNTSGAPSPDGEVVAATLTLDGNAEIYLLDARDGAIISRLTDNRAIDGEPTWSPDGRRIAFVSDRAGSPQLYVMNRDGSDQRRLTFEGSYNATPDWSPNGHYIAYTARDPHNHFDIFVVDVASSAVTRITQQQGDNEHPTWSPAGNYLIFSSTRGGGASLWMATDDGNFQVQLTASGSADVNPAWQR